MSITEVFEKQLTSNGYKITRSRHVILKVFSEFSERWLEPEEVLEKAREDEPKINFSTIYRNLDLMVRLNILCCVGGANSYYKLNEINEHHHHLICRACGKIDEIDYCPLKKSFIENKYDFDITDHKFEIYGYCSRCSSKKGSK